MSDKNSIYLLPLLSLLGSSAFVTVDLVPSSYSLPASAARRHLAQKKRLINHSASSSLHARADPAPTVVGNLSSEKYAYRNDAGGSDNPYNYFSITNGQPGFFFSNGQKVPNGDYKVLLRVLKFYADEEYGESPRPRPMLCPRDWLIDRLSLLLFLAPQSRGSPRSSPSTSRRSSSTSSLPVFCLAFGNLLPLRFCLPPLFRSLLSLAPLPLLASAAAPLLFLLLPCSTTHGTVCRSATLRSRLLLLCRTPCICSNDTIPFPLLLPVRLISWRTRVCACARQSGMPATISSHRRSCAPR